MTQAISAARQLKRQSACTVSRFASTTAATKPPIAIPARAPRTKSSMMWSMYSVFKITPSYLGRVLPECEMGLVWLLVA